MALKIRKSIPVAAAECGHIFNKTKNQPLKSLFTFV